MNIYDKNKAINCEILAPAGSYQCMITAFKAGADAIYIGGSMFGARAFADNFQTEELISAINYAHLRGKRLYLTVNTLLKADEIDNKLIEYLIPLYNSGLDAVIVQDLGVLKKIHEHFPDLHIHASTQMTVTGVNFAKELKKLGVTRIVTARELSYKEISSIYESTGLEIESFVHGALCYSYSGQCLLSSLIGGRSGNRGRCAQPCRLNYDLFNENGKVNDNSDKYLLSPKDLCTLLILPQIIQSGVFSLKIEGRMKKPQYVATVVSTYKKYVELLKHGKYKVSQSDIDTLKEIYNRGGFTDGFYNKRNGRDMMSLYKPNHYGIKVAEIVNISKGSINIKALKDIGIDDVLEINLKNNTSKEIKIKDKLNKGSLISISNLKELKSFDDLYETGIYRTRNNKLITEIENNFINKKQKVKIKGSVIIKKDKPIILSAGYNCIGFNNEIIYVEAKVSGEIPEEATNKPMSKENILKQLSKTGNTDFEFESLNIYLDDGLFIPVSVLNSIRRKCIDELKDKAVNIFSRKYNAPDYTVKLQKNKTNDKIVFDCVVSDLNQLEKVINYDFIDICALEISRFSDSNITEAIDKIHKSNKKAYVALPYICRDIAIEEFKSNNEFFTSEDIDGLIVRNYEEYFYFKNLFIDKNISKEIILDSNVYVFNKETEEYLNEFNDIYTIPYELNYKEIKKMSYYNSRIELYGFIPVMITANCLKKTTNCCNNKEYEKYYLKDRLNNKMSVVTNCKYCHNVIYNNVPLFLVDLINDISSIGINRYSLRFTIENSNEVIRVMDLIDKTLKGEFYDIKNINYDYTRGHFRRGVM